MLITDTAYNIGAGVKERDSRTEMEKKEKTATITTLQQWHRRCGVCYTLTCHVPCVPSGEGERKHDRH